MKFLWVDKVPGKALLCGIYVIVLCGAPADIPGVLYCFFIISHDRRRILHRNVTRKPNALRVVPQLHEALGMERTATAFLIFDRDAKFGADVVSTVKACRAKISSVRRCRRNSNPQCCG